MQLVHLASRLKLDFDLGEAYVHTTDRLRWLGLRGHILTYLEMTLHDAGALEHGILLASSGESAQHTTMFRRIPRAWPSVTVVASRALATGNRWTFGLGYVAGMIVTILAASIVGVAPAQLSAALSGLMTPLIAIIGGYIAYQQLRTNQQKLNFDSYERRLKVYDHVRELLRLVIRDANVHPAEVMKFWHAVSEADFLFGQDVRLYLSDLYQRAMVLHSTRAAHSAAADAKSKEFDYEKASTTMDAHLKWFLEQPEAARDLFATYMRLS
jgi:hypothetical protein